MALSTYPAMEGEAMVTIISATAQFQKLRMLRGRTFLSSGDQKKKAIVRLTPHRDATPLHPNSRARWERHRQGWRNRGDH
jgi:hypothetical protein